LGSFTRLTLDGWVEFAQARDAGAEVFSSDVRTV